MLATYFQEILGTMFVDDIRTAKADLMAMASEGLGRDLFEAALNSYLAARQSRNWTACVVVIRGVSHHD